jgi:hypothetical protein
VPFLFWNSERVEFDQDCGTGDATGAVS